MSVIGDHRDAILSRLLSEIDGIVPTKQAGKNVQARGRRPASARAVVDVWTSGTAYDLSAEMLAVHQGETWRWLFHIESATDELAFQVLEEIRAALCPADGWSPDLEDSGNLEMEDWAPLGQTETGYVVWCSMIHDRFEG